MSDSDDAYAVVHASQWLLSPAAQSEQLTAVLDYVQNTYGNAQFVPQEHAATLCAVKTAAGALATSGGCTPPLLGIGRVSSQENVAFYGTDDESQL